MRIEGSQILITGAGRGIGRFLLEKFRYEGAKVATIERDAGAADALKSECSGVLAVVADLSCADEVASALRQLEESGFVSDVVVNNAGVIHSEPLVNLLDRLDPLHSVDTWRDTLASNLDSTFFVTRAAVGDWVRKRRKGVAINMSSISAQGNAGQSAYSAAKAGVNALTKTWAKELGPFGLRFASIAPGFIDTPSTREALSEAKIAELERRIPLRKLGTLDDIYRTARFIIENDYVNGAVMEIDGGLTL
tara:strand:- start:20853 stop:21602 length:750 start_codon:yes stop_codon:yes gene_type:complete